MAPPLLLFSIFASFSLYSSHPSHAMRAELHHRDSLTYMTVPEKIRAAANRSIERVRYFHSLSRISNSMTPTEVSLSSKIYPATFEFLMEISLGSPPVTILGAPDTGSDLTWTKCAPCKNCTSANFNPRKSSSYRRLRCNSNACSNLRGLTNCGPRRSCQYSIFYGDQSSASGLLSRDSITFNSSSGKKISLPRVIFGCTKTMTGTLDRGIIGLGKGPLSLVSQFRRSTEGKFSYCLVPITETRASSFFSLGAAAEVSGATAATIPIITPSDPVSPSFYYLPLRGISIGRLRIPAELEIVIDSGTAVTMLPAGVVMAIMAELEGKIEAPKVRDPEGQFELCYAVGSDPEIVERFPEIVLEFGGGGRVGLKGENSFLPSDDGVMCLAITPSPSPRFAVLGFFAQQNFHVGYDSVKNTVTMAPTNCAALRGNGSRGVMAMTVKEEVDTEDSGRRHQSAATTAALPPSLFLPLSILACLHLSLNL